MQVDPANPHKDQPANLCEAKKGLHDLFKEVGACELTAASACLHTVCMLCVAVMLPLLQVTFFCHAALLVWLYAPAGAQGDACCQDIRMV